MILSLLHTHFLVVNYANHASFKNYVLIPLNILIPQIQMTTLQGFAIIILPQQFLIECISRTRMQSA